MPWLSRFLPYFAVGLGFLGFQSAWLSLVGYHLGILTMFWLENGWERFRALRPVFHPGWAALAWISACLAGLLLYSGWDGLPLPGNVPAMLRQLGLTETNWPWFIAYFSLVNPWLEETYWRSRPIALAKLPIADDFWFAGYHLLILVRFVPGGWLLLGVMILAGAAWFWRQVFRQTGSTFIPAVAHLLADFSILTAIYFRTVPA